LELTSQANDQSQQNDKVEGAMRAPSVSGRALGVQLPVIKRSKAKIEDSDDYVVDYFVYDDEADDKVHLESESTAVVHVENFDESLLDDYVPGGEYSDKEFDSDDSQNRDWDYGSESEGDDDSASDSDRDERRHAFFDPFAAVKGGNVRGGNEEGGDHYEDGQYHPVAFKTRRPAATIADGAGSSSEDDDGFDHFGEAYVQYREFDDFQADEAMEQD
jgi:hypothetical protein